MSENQRMITQQELHRIGQELDVAIAALGRDVSHVELTGDERQCLRYVFNQGLKFLEKVAPSIASDIRKQEELVYLFAGVAKATFPTRRSYAYPPSPNNLSVAWLFPQAIRYAATPSDAQPCYTSYPANSWDVPCTAGTNVWLFGDGTNFYRASPTADAHSFVLVFKDGLVEVGSSPTFQQFLLRSEAMPKYGPYTVEPIKEIPVEPGKAIYQYETPYGALFIPHTAGSGVMWGAKPMESGSRKVKLLGLVFYEFDFFKELKWV